LSKYEKLLKDLTNAHGVPGFEDEAIEVMKSHLKAADDIKYDKLGSLVAVRTENRKSRG
jgi:endoglucanase